MADLHRSHLSLETRTAMALAFSQRITCRRCRSAERDRLRAINEGPGGDRRGLSRPASPSSYWIGPGFEVAMPLPFRPLVGSLGLGSAGRGVAGPGPMPLPGGITWPGGGMIGNPPLGSG